MAFQRSQLHKSAWRSATIKDDRIFVEEDGGSRVEVGKFSELARSCASPLQKISRMGRRQNPDSPGRGP